MRTETVTPPAPADTAPAARPGPSSAGPTATARRTAATGPASVTPLVPAASETPADRPAAGLVVRDPTAMDQVELRDLAHRAGEPVPAQPVVVAAVDGRVVAARSVASGVLVLDRDAAPAGAGDALRRFARRR